MLRRLLLLTLFNKITALSISSTLINQTQQRLQERHYLMRENLRCQRESISLNTKQLLSEILCSLLCMIVLFLIDMGVVRLIEEGTLSVMYRLFLYISAFYETSTY